MFYIEEEVDERLEDLFKFLINFICFFFYMYIYFDIDNYGIINYLSEIESRYMYLDFFK